MEARFPRQWAGATEKAATQSIRLISDLTRDDVAVAAAAVVAHDLRHEVTCSAVSGAAICCCCWLVETLSSSLP